MPMYVHGGNVCAAERSHIDFSSSGSMNYIKSSRPQSSPLKTLLNRRLVRESNISAPPPRRSGTAFFVYCRRIHIIYYTTTRRWGYVHQLETVRAMAVPGSPVPVCMQLAYIRRESLSPMTATLLSPTTRSALAQGGRRSFPVSSGGGE